DGCGKNLVHPFPGSQVAPHLTVVWCACHENGGSGILPLGTFPNATRRIAAWTPQQHSALIWPAPPEAAAGITDHCWTVQELLSFHVPPRRWTPPKQRGRPSHALKRLIAQ